MAALLSTSSAICWMSSVSTTPRIRDSWAAASGESSLRPSLAPMPISLVVACMTCSTPSFFMRVLWISLDRVRLLCAMELTDLGQSQPKSQCTSCWMPFRRGKMSLFAIRDAFSWLMVIRRNRYSGKRTELSIMSATRLSPAICSEAMFCSAWLLIACSRFMTPLIASLVCMRRKTWAVTSCLTSCDGSVGLNTTAFALVSGRGSPVSSARTFRSIFKMCSAMLIASVDSMICSVLSSNCMVHEFMVAEPSGVKNTATDSMSIVTRWMGLLLPIHHAAIQCVTLLLKKSIFIRCMLSLTHAAAFFLAPTVADWSVAKIPLRCVSATAACKRSDSLSSIDACSVSMCIGS